jgi:hypothetical protein
MDLKGVLAISGKPGLFKLISQTKSGLIVESFEDKKKLPVYSAHQISALEEISIFTINGDVSLKSIFKTMFEILEGKEVMSAKSDKNLMMDFFEKVLPDYDEEKVYHSDVKKMFQWYNILLKNDYMVFESEEEKGNEYAEVTENVEVVEEKPKEVKKAPKKTSKKQESK